VYFKLNNQRGKAEFKNERKNKEIKNIKLIKG
jgi:hypothetical protein